MNGSYNSEKKDDSRMRKNLKRKFGQRNKGNKNTAIYNILYKEKTHKGMIINKEITHKKKKNNGYINKYKQSEETNHCISTKQALGDLFTQEFSILKENHQKEVFSLIDNFLDPNNFIYTNRFTEDMVTSLIQNESFVTTMISQSLANIMKEGKTTLNTLSHYSIANIRLNQLYQKLTISNTELYNNQQLFSIQSFEYYKLYQYIDNLIFTEFLCQIVGIGSTNELLVDNRLYTIYTASLHNDLYDGVDIILKDTDNNSIGIDVTLSKKKKSGLSPSTNNKFNKIFIANHTPIKAYFQKFYKDITEYIYGYTNQPMLDITYTIEEKQTIENRLSSIIHAENSTPSCPDQDTDNSVLTDLGENDHTQHSEIV